MELSVIIVNYNVKYFLEHCLLSVQKACAGIEAEIFVTDNHSTDGSRDYLQPRFPAVQFIWNTENLGFSKANNLALKKASGKLVLFLNPDTIVPEDCFSSCMNFFREHDNCGALGVRMIDGSGKFLRESKRSLPGLMSGFYRSVGLAKMFPKSSIFSKYYAAHLPEKETNKTEVLAGAFMMLSRKAIELTGGFDEDFFMYGEDVDLSYRITKAGLDNYYFPGTTIIHFKGESTHRQSAAFKKNFYEAMRLFIRKHYKGKWIKSFLLQSGVSLAKGFGSFRNSEKGVVGAGNNKRKTSIIGNESEKLMVQQLIKNSPDFLMDFEWGNNDAEAIIFCEGQQSNKSIIEMLQQMPKDCMALFYASCAGSIIGSSDQNTNGIFISTS